MLVYLALFLSSPVLSYIFTILKLVFPSRTYFVVMFIDLSSWSNYIFPHQLQRLSICPHELTPRPKESIQLPSLPTLAPFRQSDPLTRTVKELCAPHVPTKPISFPFCPQPRLFKDEYTLIKKPAEFKKFH